VTWTAGRILEAIEPQGDSEKTLVERIYDHGFAVGKAEVVLKVFGARQLALSDEQEQRVMACTDIEQLAVWLVRAATAATAAEVFAD
jgi:arylsulfatase A-like enzyme